MRWNKENDAVEVESSAAVAEEVEEVSEVGVESVGTFRRVVSFIRDYLYIPTALLIGYLLAGVIFVLGIVPTESMEPTYMAGSLFAGWRLTDEAEFDRGDPVLFHYDEKTIYLKRVIGLAGDTVSFSDGAVYINGEVLDESAYLDSSVKTFTTARSEFVVPEGHYFVLGDNRGVSFDSRYWNDPYVSYDAVVGTMLGCVRIPFWNLLADKK